MNMSFILQIGASHFSSVTPIKGTEDIVNETGSESRFAETSSINCRSITKLPIVATLTTFPNCCGLPYQDHNYGAPPPPTPPQSPTKLGGPLDEDTSTSVVTTSTTNEDDGPEEESVTRCICEFEHDDEYMICCDKCFVWQHVDCMGLDRNHIPDTYMCEKCEPRKVDRQKAKALQTRKKEEMTADSSSDETGDENSELKSVGGSVGNKGKKVNRRKKEKLEDKSQMIPLKRVKRRIKERVEQRRTTTRKRCKSKCVDESCHVNESAPDSWDTNIKDWMGKYEEAETNQYSPEVHLRVNNLKFNGQHEELARKVAEHPRIQLCHVSDISKTTKGLVASTDIRPRQILCECRGKFLLLSQFQQQNTLFSKRIYPFVLFYTLQKGQEDICVDCRQYGNDSRFVRRSCSPNAEVFHVIESGSLHLYIISLKNILRNEEITIAFDTDIWMEDLECACLNSNCALLKHINKNEIVESMTLERKAKKAKRLSIIEGEFNQASGPGGSLSTSKPCKTSPLRLAQSNVPCDRIVTNKTIERESDSQANVTLAIQISDEAELEEQASDRQKKMTREERKMEAIMKAFARMEKTQQRRQEALARLAQKKEEQETKRKDEKNSTCVSVPISDCGVEASLAPTYISAGECMQSSDETKPVVKLRKGKKRKHSGTQVRRRSRINSGGSDVLSPDENSTSIQNLIPIASTTLLTESTPTAVSSQSLEITPSTLISVSNGFKFPKTKKLMMTEWFSESAETSLQPLTIKTESTDFCTANPTCYIRSARSPTGINQAHLRRSSGGVMTTQISRQSTDSSLGSAKKRWLRQAMCEEVETPDQSYPFANGSLSPSLIANSPSASPLAQDLVTPLKKRRLPRESVSLDMLGSSPPSTPSPSVGGQYDSSFSIGTQSVMVAVDYEEMHCESICQSDVAKESEHDPEHECLEMNSCHSDEVLPTFEITETDNLSKRFVDDDNGPGSNCLHVDECEKPFVTSGEFEEISVTSLADCRIVEACAEEEPDEQITSTKLRGDENNGNVSCDDKQVFLCDVATSDVVAPADSSSGTRFELGETNEVDESTNGICEQITLASELMSGHCNQIESLDLQQEPNLSKPESSATSVTGSMFDTRELNAETSESNAATDLEFLSQGSTISSSTLTNQVNTTKIFNTIVDNPHLESTSYLSSSCKPSQTIKRKVSLLEYRKRKLENQSLETEACNILMAAVPSTSPAVTSTVATLSRNDLSLPPQLLTLPLFQSKSDKASSVFRKDGQNSPDDEVRWINNTTTLEHQRENLTQRLRREFGLNTDDDSDVEKQAMGLVSLQTSEGVGCYVPLSSGSQTTIVRAALPAVRNIPTIIGITGYQPSPRVLHTPCSSSTQQYTYQQFPTALYVPRQQFSPNSQVTTQCSSAAVVSQSSRPALTIRPQTNAIRQVTRTLVIGGQAPPLPPYGEQVLPAMHLQPVQLSTRTSQLLPPILPPQQLTETQFINNSSNNCSGSSVRQQSSYKQGYYK